MPVGDPTRPIPANPGNPTNPVSPQRIASQPSNPWLLSSGDPSQQQGQGYGSLWNLYQTGVINPYDANANQQLGNLGLQYGLNQAQQGLQTQNLQQQLSLGMQGFGLDQQSLNNQLNFGLQGIDISKGALGRQSTLDQQLYGLQQQLFGIQGQGLQASEQQAQFQAGQQQRSAWSGATASGATNSQGFRQSLSDIGQELQFRLGDIGRQEQQLGISQQQSGLQYNEQQAQLSDAAKRLGISEAELRSSVDIQSKRLGISEQQLNDKINNALGQLGIQGSISSLDIIDAMNNIQNGKITNLGNVIGQIASIDPSLLPR